MLLLFGECAPAWSQTLQHAALQPAAPAAALGLPVRLDLSSKLIGFPSAGLNLSNTALPTLTLPRTQTRATLSVSANTPLAAQAVAARASALQAPAAALRQDQEPLPARLETLQEGIAKDAETLSQSEGESAGAGAEKSFARLTGVRTIPSAPEVEGLSPAAAPSSLAPSSLQPAARPPAKGVPSPDARLKRNARLALTATGVFKIGMEALNIAMPLLALTYFGSAVWMATMAVTWGASMTIASLFAGGAIDRTPVNKVISIAMGMQFLSVAAIIGLLLSGAASPFLMLPLHAVSGLAMGVITTARDCIPARLLGRDHGALSKFNSKTHIIYEIAGTLAPLAVGLLIAKIGLVAGLFIHPPAYLLAAFLFWKMDLGAPPADPSIEKKPWTWGRLLEPFKRVVSDVRQGARVMSSTKELRWLGFMILGPMVVHRVVEQIMVPVFTKLILGNPSKSAFIVSGSNFGELLGAALLLSTLTAAQKQNLKPSRYRWVPWMALGTLGVWSLSMPWGLALAVPLFFLMSLSWTANDISLTSYFQSRLPKESAGKTVGFLMAAELGLIGIFSYLLGLLFDFLPVGIGMLAANAAMTVLAYFFWKGQKKLRENSPPNP
ncbi:MAG TPA: hypothetical protein DCM05_11285 [Elusimicrobia bacterium]|nr:hypothetical protein [Elusimicrobiota bacterium]